MIILFKLVLTRIEKAEVLLVVTSVVNQQDFGFRYSNFSNYESSFSFSYSYSNFWEFRYSNSVTVKLKISFSNTEMAISNDRKSAYLCIEKAVCRLICLKTVFLPLNQRFWGYLRRIFISVIVSVIEQFRYSKSFSYSNKKAISKL